MFRPKRIEVRPGNTLECGGIVIWIYHRKARVQLQYSVDWSAEEAIDDAVKAWQFAMSLVK